MAISGNSLEYTYLPFDKSGHGIWTGVFYLTAGSLGIAATYKRTKSLYIRIISLIVLCNSTKFSFYVVCNNHSLNTDWLVPW